MDGTAVMHNLRLVARDLPRLHDLELVGLREAVTWAGVVFVPRHNL